MTTRVYLKPIDGRKSFYNKAYAEINGDVITLYSYDTEICRLNKGKFERVWRHTVYDEMTGKAKSGYSTTTMRHIQAFCAAFGSEIITKKQWDNM